MALLDRQKEFTRWLVKGFPDLSLKGLPLKSASAVTGNATQENLVNAVTTGPKDHGSDGTLQWRLDRLDGPHGLKGWSAAQGLDWATLKAQAAFFLWELNRDYPALERDLRAATKSIETLTANICKFYERPNMALAHLDKRISHAQSVFKIMSEERKVPTPTKIGAGSAVVIGGAAAANQAGGGDLLWTIAGGVVALAAAIGGPLLSKWMASKPPAPAEPAKPVDAFPTGLQVALDRMRACKAELDKAVALVAEERQAMRERLDAMHAAIDAAEREAAEVAKEADEASA